MNYGHSLKIVEPITLELSCQLFLIFVSCDLSAIDKKKTCRFFLYDIQIMYSNILLVINKRYDLSFIYVVRHLKYVKIICLTK